MKRLAIAIVLFFFVNALYCWAAEEPTVNFTGNWILDQSKSDPFPGGMMGGPGGMMGGGGGMMGGPPGGMMGGPPGGRGGMGGGSRGTGPIPMVMEQHGNEVRVKNGFLIEAFICDGKQHEKENAIPGSDVKTKEKTKATLKKNKLLVESTTIGQPTSNGSMHTLRKRTYTLSEDGNTLTVETKTESIMMSTTQKQVYTKQDQPPQPDQIKK